MSTLLSYSNLNFSTANFLSFRLVIYNKSIYPIHENKIFTIKPKTLSRLNGNIIINKQGKDTQIIGRIIHSKILSLSCTTRKNLQMLKLVFSNSLTNITIINPFIPIIGNRKYVRTTLITESIRLNIK